MNQPIRVFIGSGEASLIERKVLIYSLRKHSQNDLDIYVLNGTHNSIELNDCEPSLAPMSLKLKYQNVTEFSLYRYLIPQICQHQGKAIYLDSDMICLTDIQELHDTDLQNHSFLAKREAYTHSGEKLWGLSAMLLDCEKCHFDLETYFNEIAIQKYTYQDFSCMSPEFLSHHPFSIGELDPNWNVFDHCDRNTKLIHYTNLITQPWKFPNHPFEALWFQYFQEALETGFISDRDIELSLLRSTVRQDIQNCLSPKRSSIKTWLRPLKQALQR